MEQKKDTIKSVKILLDVVMTVILLLLIETDVTGLFLHELLGIFVMIMFLYHVFLNRRWVRGMSKAMKAKKATGKAKVMVGLNTLLAVSVLVMVISSLLISRELVPNTLVTETMLWVNIHVYTGYALMILVGVHLLFHAKQLLHTLKRALRQKNALKRSGAIVSLAVVGFATVRGAMSIGAELQRSSVAQAGQLQTAIVEEEKVLEEAEDTLQAPVEDLTKTPSEEVLDTAETEEAVIQEAVTPVSETPTLEEYLSTLYCTGCAKTCPLTTLECRKGSSYLEQAEKDYQLLYASA